MARLFEYGSVMGDNALRQYEGRPARLAGFHRSFNHGSTLRWGTPDAPCPILGLSPGGECWGVAFDVPKADEKQVLRTLDRREAGDEYRRAAQRVELGEGAVEAWVWASRPEHADGRRWGDPARLEQALRNAHGTVGTGVEYVRTLVHALDQWRIEDTLIRSLWERLQP